jgi:NodT family efflux transporter outer membrane factor (OMF) lipoprotein
MKRALWFACAALSAGGCVVGPNYRGPPADASVSPTFHRTDDVIVDTQPAVQWWTALDDHELNQLVETALRGSPNIAVAQARLRQARAVLKEQRANELPNTGVDAAYLRTRNLTSLLGGSSSGSSGGNGSSGGGGTQNSSAFSLYAVGFDATWEIDFWGAHARAAEGAAAATQGARANLADVQVGLSAEVAQAYIRLRDAQQRMLLTERNIDIETHVVDLVRIRRAGGTASELDLQRFVNQLDSTRATLAPLRAAIAEQLNRLALLSGRAPGALDEELASTAEVPAPPTRVVIGDPAAMLRRRPDIVVAERRLAQQTAAVGESVAALFPKVTLLGDVGFTSLSASTLFDGGSFTYVAAPILQWTPLDFGRNRARIAQAGAAREEAEANYRETVLAALQDAETSLAQYAEQRNSVQDMARVKDSAERVYALTEVRLRGGTAATIDVLDADARRVQADLSYEQALAQLTEYYVSLQKSLGLGWTDSGH